MEGSLRSIEEVLTSIIPTPDGGTQEDRPHEPDEKERPPSLIYRIGGGETIIEGESDGIITIYESGCSTTAPGETLGAERTPTQRRVWEGIKGDFKDVFDDRPGKGEGPGMEINVQPGTPPSY